MEENGYIYVLLNPSFERDVLKGVKSRLILHNNDEILYSLKRPFRHSQRPAYRDVSTSLYVKLENMIDCHG